MANQDEQAKAAAAEAKASEEAKEQAEREAADKAAAEAKASEEATSPVPVVPIRGEDCQGVSKKIRTYIDSKYGEDFRVLSIGTTSAYIENAKVGFKIKLT
jgi:hypothetical protein